MDARTRLLLEGPPGITILRLAWPNILVMGAQASIGLIETWYVSRLGADALAGMALVFPSFMLLQMVSAGAVGGGILSTMARTIGARKIDLANRLVWAVVAITLALGIAATVCAIAFGRQLYALQGGEGGGLEAAVLYSTVAFGGAVPQWLFNSFAAVIRAQGNMFFPAAVTVIGTVLLIPLSPLLIFGAGPVPPLGIVGGATAVVLYYIVGTLVLGWHIWSGRGVIRPSFRPTALPWRAMGEILRVGLVSALTSLSTNVTIVAAMSFAATVNGAAVAGYGTAVRLEYLLVPLVFGLGAPTAAMVGTSIGAGQRGRARHVAWVAAAIAGGITETIGLTAALVPSLWLGLFTDDPAISASGATYLRIVGPTYGFFGAGLCLYFAAQGAGVVVLPFLAAMMRVCLVVLPGAFIVAAFGVRGLYLDLAAAMAVYFSINIVTLRNGRSRSERSSGR